MDIELNKNYCNHGSLKRIGKAKVFYKTAKMGLSISIGKKPWHEKMFTNSETFLETGTKNTVRIYRLSIMVLFLVIRMRYLIRE